MAEELLGPEMPSMSPMDSEIVKTVVATAAEVYGHEPVIDPISPGSSPSYLFCDKFGIPMVGAGVGYSGSNVHAPNENIRVEDYIQGIKHIALILDRFGTGP